MANYATDAQIKAALRVSDSVDDALVSMAGSAATELIDGHCGRSFAAAGTVTRLHAAADTAFVRVDDLAGTAITLTTSPSADGVFDQAWAAADWQLEPLNPATGWPYTAIRAVGSLAFPVADGEACVKVTGAHGWAAVPAAITQACVIQAQRLFKRLDSPLGVAGWGDLGVMRVGRGLDPDVAQLVAPYRRIGGVA